MLFHPFKPKEISALFFKVTELNIEKEEKYMLTKTNAATAFEKAIHAIRENRKITSTIVNEQFQLVKEIIQTLQVHQ